MSPLPPISPDSANAKRSSDQEPPSRLFREAAWADPRRGRFSAVIAFILFALTGFVFGWALSGKSAYVVPILIPLLIALPTALKQGADGRFVADLILALALTIGGDISTQ